MLLKVTLALALIMAAASQPTTSPEESSSPTTDMALCPCEDAKAKKSATTPNPSLVSKLSHSMVHGMKCVCHTGPAPDARDDYQYSPHGAHKLHTRAATWNDARKMCNEEGGHLAIVNTIAEADHLKNMFNKSGKIMNAGYQDIAFLGIHDLYKEGEWTTVLGESLFKTGYTKWSDKWGGQPDNGGGNQNCGGFCRDGDLDDVNCDVPFAFFCEIPMSYIVH